MSCSEYRFRPEAVDELFPREYVNAVHLSCARFVSVAVFGGAGRKRPAPLETAGDARVEEVELRRLDGLAREAFSPNRHFACEKGVLEDLEVLLNRGAWDLRVGGDGLIVDLFAACERGDFERNNSFRRAA